jgi:isopenicillin N synthase-like dioxygenase
VLGPAQRRLLLSLFALPEADIRKLWRWNFDPAQTNVYRGWFPLQNGLPTYKEGIDMGPDLAWGGRVVDAADPLREATPLPPEAALPGWHAQARSYYLAMTRLALALMHAIARGLRLPENHFDAAFDPGVSTLRLLHYPVRPAGSLDGVEGLQAQHRDGHWIEVPPQEGSLAVNFGKVLELWAVMTRFLEQRGIAHLRTPRAAAAACADH